MRSIAGFTLIELLVVIAIIITLLAILLPSMNRAVEVANRTVCASQEHQIGIGLISYASDHFSKFPPGNATDAPSWGRPSRYIVSQNRPLGPGYLITEGYLPTAEVLYCPSWSHPTIQYDTIDVNGIDPWFGPNQLGGWPAPGNAGPTLIWLDTYFYRSSFVGSDNLANDPPSLQLHGSGVAIMADEFSWREVLYGVVYGHNEGYTVLSIDASTKWVDVSPIEIEAAQTPVNNHKWSELELFVWQPYFDQR